MPSIEKQISIRLKLVDEMSKALDGPANSLKKMGDSLTSVGTKMTAAFTVPIVAMGTAAVKASADFEQSLANIRSITNLTKEGANALGEQFIKLSMDITKTTDSAQNLSEAYYTIVGSGVDAAEAMGVLEAATKAASAGLTTTETAAQAMVAVMNAYGLEASEAARISDLMFQTVNRGVGTFEQLSGAMGSVVGSAAQLKVAEEELFAAIATLSKQGQSFETATTNINAALTSLMKPTEAMQKAFHDLGYESGSAMIEALGFAGTMQKLAEYTGGSQEAMAALFGDVRSMRAAFGLTGAAAGMFAEDMAAMNASTGATADAFAKQTDTFQAALKNLQNVWQAFLIDLGNVLMPILTPILQGLSALLQAFMALPEPVKQIIVVIGGLLAVVGPLLLIFGQIAGAITAIQTLMTAMPAIMAVFASVSLPVIALIVAIVTAIGLLIANWNQLGTTMQQIGTIIDHSMGNVFSKSKTTLEQLAALVQHAWSEMLQKAGTTLSQLGQIIMAGLGKLAQLGVQLGGQFIQGFTNAIVSGFKQLVVWLLGKANEMIANVRKAFGIASPSKVMAKIGEQVTAGFHEGIQSMGGIGVNVPQVSGGRGATPSLSYAGAGASGGGGNGSGNVYIENLTVPAGTTQEQIKYIMKEIGKEAARLGAKPIK